MAEKNDLSGTIGFIGYADILQLLGSIASTGVLEVCDPFDFCAYIFFDGGEIIHSELNDLSPQEAFFVPFTWDKGNFVFKSGEVNCRKTIENSLTGLILEGLRLLDEGAINQSSKNLSMLAKIPVLRGNLVDYSEIVDEEFFEKEEAIVKEGRYGSWIWVILDGLVQIEKNLKGKSIPVMQLGRGGFIGSVAAFAKGDRPRSATAKALSRVQLGVLDAQSLSKEYTAYSDLLRNYLVCLDERLRLVTSKYSDLYINNIDNIFSSGSVKGIMKETFKDNKLGIVVSGSANLYLESKGEMVKLGVLNRDDLVGELPFIEKSKAYSFHIAGDEDFAVRPFDRNLLAEEFVNISESLKKMLEFTGLTLSVTAYNLAKYIGFKK